MIFQGICTGEACRQDQTHFEWYLFNERNGKQLHLTNSKSLELLEIAGNFLGEGEEYRLQVNGTLTERIKSFQLYNFVTNESPSGGDCVANQMKGTVLETNFTFTCSGWKDKDKNLTFQFGYTSSSGAHEILQWSTKTTMHTNKLPLGNPIGGNMVSVDIFIKDQWGGNGYKRVQVQVCILYQTFLVLPP